MKKIIYILICFVYSNEYYVSKSGSLSNLGTYNSPFLSVQQAVDIMEAGDICYIRQGVYHENISIDNKDGNESNPIIFTSYNNERVVFDGTVKIENEWIPYSGNIWKTEIDFDIWQLFVDNEEMVMARWPNANFEDGSIWDKENNWAHGIIDSDENAYVNGTMIDEPHGNISLENIGFDISGSVAILNVGSFETYTREVLTHNGNTFTYEPVDESGWRTKHHDYFLEKKLEFLDSEGEWFYDINSSSIYLWAPGNVNPNSLNIRGKIQSYAFDIVNSDYVEIRNIEFFGTTFKFHNCDYSKVYNCNLVYPSCYKRMLGIVGVEPDMSIFTSSSNCIVSNSAFRYTDGSAIEMYSNNNTIENCYFYHIDYSVADLSSVMTTVRMGGSNNIFRRNTMHKMGASSTLNVGNASIIELNDISDSGYLQSDGALVHCMINQQPNIQVRYNWLHDTIKYGVRFDGEGDGYGGYVHHNVIWNVQGGIMIKGYNHNIYNNTAFDNGNKNDIIIMIEQGGNDGTITLNNIANKIAGHRTGTYESYPVPGNYVNNWNGYETNLDIKDFLVDPENNDFRLLDSSSLIDSGIQYGDISVDYYGAYPDLGAYEHDGDHWIPGITWSVEEQFGTEFIFPQDIEILFGDINLDNIINVVDIVAVVNMILSDIYELIADLNDDQIINVLDIVQLVDIILS